MSAPPVVLTVAGTDSGGAAGVAADLAAFGHLGCHGACVVTAVTAQDTVGVRAVHPVPIAVVDDQIGAVLDDLPVAVVKTGMLGTPTVVALVADRLCHLPLVVDPVLSATSGAVLAGRSVVDAYVERLLPRAWVATPNHEEARVLAGRDGPPAALAARLADVGCAIVLTGGPEWQPGRREEATCTDWVCLPGGRAEPLRHRAVPTTADHGSGCTFASALAALLAAGRGPSSHQGSGGTPGDLTVDVLRSASRAAAAYVADQLITSSTWDLGRGRGPIAHISRHHQEETA
ncbi:bifunctional hydroxymethylpyrimidine kinase/phosphomethylpyrimidine kinase [Nocardioides sp.]|uniref:bifunctional hydroxymethylpyrimidine kinase/phosphomethylpyrimidine kinase n=1 Tax=Nocardioides sp. TaxID=35761 RepID=UPI002BF650F0|nr:bifunctional hydroxymethylpyrimidine kinase/phosphomethylpyrimidine kinase [Nocardioides sp.]HXH77637.1 bifunctional hydroxymethylpyrimidine kinase/phosphomethylpyrimidine kinase [Nocardioides sp.]